MLSQYHFEIFCYGKELPDRPKEALTPKQQEVFDLACQGFTDKQIARMTGLRNDSGVASHLAYCRAKGHKVEINAK